MYVTEQTRFKCFNTALHSYSTYKILNLHLLMMPCYMFTVTCLLSVFGPCSVCVPAGGGWHDWCMLWGVMWRGRSVCDCVWGVETGDRHADVWVLLDGAWRVGRRPRLLLLLRSCVVPILSYNLDYG